MDKDKDKNKNKNKDKDIGIGKDRHKGHTLTRPKEGGGRGTHEAKKDTKMTEDWRTLGLGFGFGFGFGFGI